MKKIIVLLLCLLLASCSPKITISEENYKIIKYDELQTKIENKESFIFYIGQERCSNCYEYLETLQTYFKENKDDVIYYISYEENFASGMPFNGKQSEFSNKAYELLGKKYYEDYGFLKENLYTPTTFRVIRGEYESAYIGSLSSYLLDDLFDLPLDNNIIREKIGYTDALDNLRNLTDSLFYLGQKNCTACRELEQFLDHHEKVDSVINVGYLDYADIKDNKEVQSELLNYIIGSTGNLDYLESGFLTPTIFKIKDGILSVTIGVPTLEELENLLK